MGTAPAEAPATQARIELQRSGDTIATRELLEFKLAHAAARDAVHAPWHYETLKSSLEALGKKCLVVSSQVDNRSTYLKRPDLGRRLCKTSQELLRSHRRATAFELAFIVSDGLSALAVEKHFFGLLAALQTCPLWYQQEGAPVILAPFSRVALCDEIGALLNANLTVLFIGERPGLSACDSLGVYLTYDPKPGNTDANRNCLSNIRVPGGLDYASAVQKLQHLIHASLAGKVSGVTLKEEATKGPAATSVYDR